MGSVWGNHLHLSLFGESHGPAIGMVLDGFPAGVTIDQNMLAAFLARRAPGGGSWATARRESDQPHILSGVLDGVTTGAPITITMENANTRSGDYSLMQDMPRPGHADYTGSVRYGGHNDLRGGGHFSGRLTAPLTAAGALCLQFLAARGIQVRAHIAQIAGVCDHAMADMAFAPLSDPFPVYDQAAKEQMLCAIQQAKNDGDSVGGVVECAALGVPAGLGSPMMDTVESRLCSLLFAVPAVKGVEFGDGFQLARLRGSQANDPWEPAPDGSLRPQSHHNGGILGGITAGSPLLFRAAIKPTPSIARPQQTWSRQQQAMATLCIKGRHDPCIVPRAVPVIEGACALVLTDLYLEAYGYGLA